MPLTEQQVREIRELAAKTTPGPWAYRPEEYDDWGFVRGNRSDSLPGDLIAHVRKSNYLDDDVLDAHRKAHTDPCRDDGTYIARLDPQTVTALCDAWLENAALRALLAQAGEALEPWKLAAELIPADQEDFKVVAHVPAGPHAMAFRKMGALLTAGDFRRARTTSTQIKEATRS